MWMMPSSPLNTDICGVTVKSLWRVLSSGRICSREVSWVLISSYFFSLSGEEIIGLAGLEIQVSGSLDVRGETSLLQALKYQVNGGAFNVGYACNGAGQGLVQLQQGQINRSLFFGETNFVEDF